MDGDVWHQSGTEPVSRSRVLWGSHKTRCSRFVRHTKREAYMRLAKMRYSTAPSEWNEGWAVHGALWDWCMYIYTFFSCPADSSIGDLVTHSLTDWDTFWKHNNRMTLQTCEVWDIWSEWWGDMTWPTKIQWQRQIQRQRQWQRQIHLESIFKERS